MAVGAVEASQGSFLEPVLVASATRLRVSSLLPERRCARICRASFEPPLGIETPLGIQTIVL